jgi:hypothetical protein
LNIKKLSGFTPVKRKKGKEAKTSFQREAHPEPFFSQISGDLQGLQKPTGPVPETGR